MIVKPVLGDGGYLPIGPDFPRSVEQLCREQRLQLIVDEVQPGRAVQHYGEACIASCPPLVVTDDEIELGLLAYQTALHVSA